MSGTSFQSVTVGLWVCDGTRMYKLLDGVLFGIAVIHDEHSCHTRVRVRVTRYAVWRKFLPFSVIDLASIVTRRAGRDANTHIRARACAHFK